MSLDEATKDLIGNKDVAKDLIAWVRDFGKSARRCYLLQGEHGIGKSTLVEHALRVNGYAMELFPTSYFKHATFKTELMRSTNDGRGSLTSLLQAGKRAIVIDNMDEITVSAEKENITNMIKDNHDKPTFPIILVAGTRYSRFLATLKNSAAIRYMRMYPPSAYELRNRLVALAPVLGVNIEPGMEATVVSTLVEMAKGDVRQSVHLLKDAGLAFGPAPITAEQIAAYKANAMTKRTDAGIFEASRALLDGYESIEDCLTSYDVDKALVPLTVYENYYRALNTKGLSQREQLGVALATVESMSKAEAVESQMYADGSFELQGTHGFFAVANPSYLINAKKAVHGPTRYQMDMSTELNRATIRTSAKKQMAALAAVLPGYEVNDLPFLGKVLADAKGAAGSTAGTRAATKGVYAAFKAKYKLDARQMDALMKLARA